MALPEVPHSSSRGALAQHPDGDRPHPGMLIVFVGIDGCGKGTQIDLLKSRLTSEGLGDKLVFSKQPGGTPVGMEIRRILFETVGSKNMSPLTYQHLCGVSHFEGCSAIIEPALQAGKIVICDRWHPYCAPAYNDQYVPPPSIEPDVIVHLWGDPQVFLDRALRRVPETHQATKPWNKMAVLGQIQDRYVKNLNRLAAYVPLRSDRGTPSFVAERLWVNSLQHLRSLHGSA